MLTHYNKRSNIVAPLLSPDRTTVFKRNVDQTYKLKMKASKYVLNQITADFPTMPFSLRMVEDERQAKMGVTELVTHNLLSAYPVFNERDGAFVAHFKTTVLVMTSGSKKVTGEELPGYYVTEKILDEENQALLDEVKAAEEKKKAKVRRDVGGGFILILNRCEENQ